MTSEGQVRRISERSTLRLGAAVACALVALGLVCAAPAAFREVAPGYAWSFPRDHWPHERFKTEWWYFTGHLAAEGDPSRAFGYQFTVFKVGLLPEIPRLRSAWAARNLLMGHAALTDLHGRRHVFSEMLWREMPLLAGFGAWPDPQLAWGRAPAGTDGTWRLRWNGRGFEVVHAGRLPRHRVRPDPAALP